MRIPRSESIQRLKDAYVTDKYVRIGQTISRTNDKINNHYVTLNGKYNNKIENISPSLLIMQSKISNALTVFFIGLSTILLMISVNMIGNIMIIHSTTAFTISIIGESYVSQKGYYHYNDTNTIFIRNVPLWIPFMWTSSLQVLMFLTIYTNILGGLLLSGILLFAIDIILVEPILCKGAMLWTWKSVDNGYFSFIKHRFNKFTAPFGNYLTWFLFPVIVNGLFCLLILI